MKQVLISFALLISSVFILLWLAQVHQFFPDNIDDMWVAVFCISFLIVGVFVVKRIFRKTTVIVQRSSIINYVQLSKAGISRREGEILVLIDEGLTNQQIADRLFVSKNTVQKHIDNILAKLEVNQRAESVKKAKKLSILL